MTEVKSDPIDVERLVAAMADPATRTPEVVNAYYTLCIPFYREFLGRHWHTGYYAPSGPLGPKDQLRMELRIAASADVGPGCAVLDVGCGIGGTACHLAQVMGARVQGLTPNTTQLDMASSYAKAQGLEDRVTFVQGQAGELPFPDASFDVVLFFESACHFPDRERFFREAHRVLRPGGRLAGEDWLAATGLDEELKRRHIAPLCDTWAIPELGTLETYAAGMAGAGFEVLERVDLRDEMALLRGFIVDEEDRQEVRHEIAASRDPVRRLIMSALLILGEAAAAGAFTLGRFLAMKTMAP